MDALRLALEQEIHIAVVDLHLPGMEGLELMQSLWWLNEEMEVILITGDYSVESAAEAMDHGAYDFLPKPIDFAHLRQDLNAIREQLLLRITRATREIG